MKIIAILLLVAATAQAKPVKIARVGETQSGRRVVKTETGAYYIESRPATAQEIYEAYHQQMHDMMEDQSDLPRIEIDERKRDYAGVYRNQNLHNPPYKSFVGFSLPSGKPMQAWTYRYTKAERKANLDKNIARPRNYQEIISPNNSGVLLVGGCDNPQYPMDQSDPMSEGRVQCGAALKLFVKIR